MTEHREIALARLNARNAANDAEAAVVKRLARYIDNSEKIRGLLADEEFLNQLRRWRENVDLLQSLPPESTP